MTATDHAIDPERSDAEVLADLLDRALAGDWDDDGEVLAVLRQAGTDDPDDLELAVKRIEAPPAVELEPFEADGGCRAVALSSLRPTPVPAGAGVVRFTLAVDGRAGATVVRYADGPVERRPWAYGPQADALRASFHLLAL